MTLQQTIDTALAKQWPRTKRSLRMRESDLQGYVVERSKAMPSGCIEWQGACKDNGYGVLGVGGRTYYVHRIACAAAHGPLGDLWALHSCDNRRCVNPAHLRPGTAKDNAADAVERHRAKAPPVTPWPEIMMTKRHHWQRLDRADIPVIRERLSRGDRVCDIARSYGVAWQTIGNIKAGTRWAHVP